MLIYNKKFLDYNEFRKTFARPNISIVLSTIFLTISFDILP